MLGIKAEIDLIFALLPLVIRNPNMVYIFLLLKSRFNSKATKLLRCSKELNRESRENREWSRRCDPAFFVLNEKGTLLVTICHCFD